MTSKCSKNKAVAHKAQQVNVSLLFLPHFDVFCDLLLYKPFSQKIPSVSVVQFPVQMFKLNGLGKTHRERIFVVELKLKRRSLFHYEQIV